MVYNKFYLKNLATSYSWWSKMANLWDHVANAEITHSYANDIEAEWQDKLRLTGIHVKARPRGKTWFLRESRKEQLHWFYSDADTLSAQYLITPVSCSLSQLWEVAICISFWQGTKLRLREVKYISKTMQKNSRFIITHGRFQCCCTLPYGVMSHTYITSASVSKWRWPIRTDNT